MGNKLFPWARAVVYARKYGFNIIAPKWWHIPVGPFLRREKSKRLYFGSFTNKGYINGVEKFRILISGNIVKEEDINQEKILGLNECKHSKNTVILFRGLKNYFYDFKDKHELIRRELIGIVSPRQIQALGEFNKHCIVVHVRMGDTATWCAPIGWFVSTIHRLKREPCLANMPIKIFSDEYPEKLRPILDIENTELVTLGSAIADLLAMSTGTILVASAHSAFSMWASFLGRMPTLYAAGETRQKLFEGNEQIYEGELNPDDELPELLKLNLLHIARQKALFKQTP